MANGHGGSRPPAKPAPVSGPGKYSKRTDGGPAQVMSAAPDQEYGAMKTQLDAQRAAPMAGTAPLPPPASPDGGGGGAQAPAMPAYQGGALDAPSERPNEPVTAGVDIGPGAGASALSFQQAPRPGAGSGQMTAMLQKFSSTDTTGILGQLMTAARDRGA